MGLIQLLARAEECLEEDPDLYVVGAFILWNSSPNDRSLEYQAALLCKEAVEKSSLRTKKIEGTKYIKSHEKISKDDVFPLHFHARNYLNNYLSNPLHDGFRLEYSDSNVVDNSAFFTALDKLNELQEKLENSDNIMLGHGQHVLAYNRAVIDLWHKSSKLYFEMLKSQA